MGLYVGTKEALGVHAGAQDALAVYRGSELVWSSEPPPPPPSRHNTFEGGTIGEDITAANSGGASGDAFDIVSVGSIPVYRASSRGGVCMEMPPNAVGSLVQWNSTGLAEPMEDSTEGSCGFWFRADEGVAGTARIMDFRTTITATCAALAYNGSRFMPLDGLTNVPEGESPITTPGDWYWVSIIVRNAGAENVLGLRILNADGSRFHDWEAPITGTPDLVRAVRVGCTTGNRAGLMWVDGIEYLHNSYQHRQPA